MIVIGAALLAAADLPDKWVCAARSPEAGYTAAYSR
jgi:hypothetical protein